MSDLAILIPVLGRPERAAPALLSVREATPDAHVLFLASHGDALEQEAIRDAGGRLVVVPWKPGPGDYARKINLGFALVTGRGPGRRRPLEDVEWVFLGADDLIFHPGWYEACLRRHRANGACVIGTNDLGNHRTVTGQHSTHTLVNRGYWDCGTADEPHKILHEQYQHEFCNPPDAPIWMADLTFKTIGNICVGDRVIGWEYNAVARPAPGSPRRSLCYSEVLAVARRAAPLVRVCMESGREFTCTPDHRWLNAAWMPASRHNAQWVEPRVGRNLLHIVDEPSVESINRLGSPRMAAWLAGIYDGEGSGIVIASQSDGNEVVVAGIVHALEILEIPYTHSRTPDGMNHFTLRGGRQAYLEFLLRVRPYRDRALRSYIVGYRRRDDSRTDRAEIGARRFGHRDRIVAVEPLPGVHEVVSMTTTSGNYVAHGFASRNCDDELVHTARWRGAYDHATEAIVEHLHPDWGKGPEDDTYRKARAGRTADLQLFNQRQAAYWLNRGARP